MAFELPDLPYAYDALDPYMSAETLEYHHDKHHQAYVTNGSKLLEGSGLEGKSLEEVVKGSFGKNAGLFNNAAQHYNHIHFWKWMKPNGGGSIPGNLESKINSDLGSVSAFRDAFLNAGATQFGSGLMTRWTSLPSCLTMLYIEGAYQASVSAPCCWERSTPKAFWPGAVPPCLFTGQL